MFKKLIIFILVCVISINVFANGYCSGFFISPDGYIATAGHCDEGKLTAIYNTVSGLKIEKATVIYVDHNHDFMILKIDAKNTPYLNVNPLTQQGDKVIGMGWPDTSQFGYSLKKFPGTVLGTNDGTITIYMRIAPGFSGGALINESNITVVGIIIGMYRLPGLDYGDTGAATSSKFLLDEMIKLGILSFNGTADIQNAAVYISIED